MAPAGHRTGYVALHSQSSVKRASCWQRRSSLGLSVCILRSSLAACCCVPHRCRGSLYPVSESSPLSALVALQAHTSRAYRGCVARCCSAATGVALYWKGSVDLAASTLRLLLPCGRSRAGPYKVTHIAGLRTGIQMAAEGGSRRCAFVSAVSVFIDDGIRH